MSAGGKSYGFTDDRVLTGVEISDDDIARLDKALSGWWTGKGNIVRAVKTPTCKHDKSKPGFKIIADGFPQLKFAHLKDDLGRQDLYLMYWESDLSDKDQWGAKIAGNLGAVHSIETLIERIREAKTLSGVMCFEA